MSFLQRDSLVWGPLFLLSTLAIATKTPYDLILVALLGLYLCARFKIRGCCYALILLGFSAIVKHAFFTTDHLWQLGLESSLGCAFFITALAFEQGESFLESLKSQMDTRKATLANLEDELAKVQQMAQEQQICFQEKVATMQKELEDLQAEHSSILILNEVLRKTTARSTEESEALTAKLFDKERQFDLLKAEFQECENDLTRLLSTDAVVQQNRELMKELNAARYEKEQTHFINETLARLFARESLKVKEAEQEASSLSEQLAASRKEIARLAEVKSESNSLREEKQDPQLAEQLQFAQERVVHLSQVEHLFKQLKKQFEEKNQILHQTRTDLFKADTQLQKLTMEKSALDLNPIPKEVERELQDLGEQVQVLEEENQQLQELISVLSGNSSDAAKRKKKVKIQTPPEQELLF